MRVGEQILMINVENDITIGNGGGIELTVIHQAIISRDGDKLDLDLELVDYVNVKFMGILIQGGYDGFKRFKAQMKELGIDVGKLINEKCDTLFTKQDKQYLKSLWGKM